MKNLFLVLLFASFTQVSFAQTQLGSDIDGEIGGDRCGLSVTLSADGKTAAIGSPSKLGRFVSAGNVRIFKYASGTWTQLGDHIVGEAKDDESGASVSLSADGSIVAIGAPYNSGKNGYAGHVRVYKYASGVWNQLGADIDGEDEQGDFGVSVSLSADGSTVAIGEPYNSGNGVFSGSARIYKYASGVWTQLGADINGKTEAENSAFSVSLSQDGKTVAIGAFLANGGGVQRGVARVYKYSAGTWTQWGADISGEADDDLSGVSVSLSGNGNILAIGSEQNDGIGAKAGHVRVYQNTSGTWTQLGADIDGEATGDQTGGSVSLSQDGYTLAIGAIRNDGNGVDAGHVRIYKYASGSWTKFGIDIDGEAAGDESGFCVFLSADGNTVATGTPKNTANGSEAGHVRIYSLSNSTSVDRSDKGKTLSIFPNPASNEIKINVDANLIGNKYRILNSTGQEVLNGTITEKSTRIDLGNLSIGYYLLSVGENNIQTHKLVIE